MTDNTILAAVLIRGTVNVRHDIKQALVTLKLLRKHACVVVKDTPAVRGLLIKCKDYITYGPISAEMQATLQKKGAVANLHPPRGGFERKGIKVSYQSGGALGLRQETMDALLKRML